MFELGIGKRWSGALVLLVGLSVAAPTITGCPKPPEEKKADDKATKDDKKSKDDDKKKKSSNDDDDDDDDKKKDDKKKKKPASDDDDDDDDDKKKDDKKKKKPASDDDDDDDDDTSAIKKKKPAGDDDDDDDAPPKKKPATPTDAIDVVGAYSLKGAGPDGKTYSGSGTVARIGGSGSEMYNISWLIGGSTYKGIAFRDGDILSCGWTEAKAGGDNDRDLGVIAFLVKDDGNMLDGVWFEPGETTLGKELLTGGTSNLTGTYTIKSGLTPTTKKKYTGTVTVSLKSGVYNLLWNIGTGTSKGFGIRNGDVLSAAFTDSGGMFGVMQYRITKGGNVLAGQWAQTGQSTPGIGTETMTKK